MTEVMCEQLSRGESLDVLALGNLGQLILLRAALPTAVPTRHLVEQDRVLVHVLAGPTRPAWHNGDVLTLHASAFDAAQQFGWSVAVTSHACSTPDLTCTPNPPNAPWIPTGGGDLIELMVEAVQGERLGPTNAAAQDAKDHDRDEDPTS
jgi:hypothetical protein